MSKVQKPSLFKQDATLQDISDKWDLVETLFGGTDAMRAAGRQYLPQNPKEPVDKYRDRLNRATLTNKYVRTIEKGVGKAFARKMNVILPAPLEPLLMNADGQGTSFESFSKQILKDAINYGITYVLVDYPSSVGPTLADQRASGAFPYFVEIKPTQLLDLRVDYINNQVQLTYFRFYESLVDYSDAGGIQSVNVEQVKEFVLSDDGSVVYNIYRKDKNKAEYLVESGIVSTNMIPIACIKQCY